MSVIQSQQSEVRFLKRKNLEEEARIHGNMLADMIRMYGIDCVYHKLNTDVFGNFKNIVDSNTILKHAYGYNVQPDYTCSANMITYPEVHTDIFGLQKYGVIPEAEIDFNFDAKQFACDLATKCGQLKEYPINEIEINCEVPDCPIDIIEHYDEKSGQFIIENFISDDIFPYQLGLGYKELYTCGILSGKLSVEINGYTYDISSQVMCHGYEHSDFSVSFPKNSDLYKSLTYTIHNDDFIDSLIFMDYSVHKNIITFITENYKPLYEQIADVIELKKETIYFNNFFMNNKSLRLKKVFPANITTLVQLKKLIYKLCDKFNIAHTASSDIQILINVMAELCKSQIGVAVKTPIAKNVLTGKIHGSILFYDIHKIGKYIELIHPEVGDVITIDFPDEKNREQYEITDCYDKSLQTDGISPLLHKYIWKCKAKRYVPSYEDAGLEQNEANERMDEKIKYQQLIENEITKKIEMYDVISGDIKEDSVYGGYDNVITEYDQTKPNPAIDMDYEFVDDGTYIDIIIFGCQSKLVTNGYELIFIDANNNGYKLTTMDHSPVVRDAYFECGLKWFKASKTRIVFNNIEGESTVLIFDEEATDYNQISEINLDDLHEKTLDVTKHINTNGNNFLKFSGCNSWLCASREHLYTKLESNNQAYQLV